MDLEQLLRLSPRLHERDGVPVSWALSDDSLRYIGGAVTAGSRTLETGAGLSTVVFALTGAEHTCVTPDAGDIERIERFCAANGISLQQVDFALGPSQELLPAMQTGPLDLVLIDGGHGFPLPALDWFYLAPWLRIGGELLVDDIPLFPPQILYRFLRQEPEWHLDRLIAGSTAVFRKLAESGAKEWTEQPFTVWQSDLSAVVRNRTLSRLSGVDGWQLMVEMARKGEAMAALRLLPPLLQREADRLRRWRPWRP